MFREVIIELQSSQQFAKPFLQNFSTKVLLIYIGPYNPKSSYWFSFVVSFFRAKW